MDYTYLRGKIISKYGTLEKCTKECHFSRNFLSKTLNNKRQMKVNDELKLIQALNLDSTEANKCFFVVN